MPPEANGVRPKCYPLAAPGPGSSDAAGAFSSESLLRTAGWRPVLRREDASIKNREPRFVSIETETASGDIQQLKVRQQVHGEIAAKRSIAVAAVATDSSDLDRALVELDVVALMSLGC